MAKRILQERNEALDSVPGLAELLVDADSGRDPGRIAQASDTAINVSGSNLAAFIEFPWAVGGDLRPVSISCAPTRWPARHRLRSGGTFGGMARRPNW